MAEDLLSAVSLALVGEDVVLATGAAGERAAGESPAVTTPQQVAEALDRAGWSAARVAELRRECQQNERAWPFVVDRELLAGVGFARHGAVLKETRRLLGVDGLVPSVHRGPRVIGPAEQRLLNERPPHHGNVG